MHFGAEREELSGLDHAHAIAAPVRLTDFRLGDGHEVFANKGVPSPIGHEFSGLNGPVIGVVRLLGDLDPIDGPDFEESAGFGAALEQREKRSEHRQSVAQNGNLQHWIGEAMKGSGWDVSEILEGVQRGDFHLFLHDEGCMVGEFITSPRHKVIHIFAAGGSLRAMAELGPVIEAFGRLHNCDYSAATGRKGWVRYARRFGYRRADPAIEKEL